MIKGMEEETQVRNKKALRSVGGGECGEVGWWWEWGLMGEDEVKWGGGGGGVGRGERMQEVFKNRFLRE